jgi:hypothetical protein
VDAGAIQAVVRSDDADGYRAAGASDRHTEEVALRLGLGLLVPNEVVTTPMLEAQFEFLYPPNSVII